MQKNHHFQKQSIDLKVFMPNKKKIKFFQAINAALKKSMRKDKKLICYGLGVTDPKAIFGTCKDLLKLFGNKRVFDVPCSENALTGISIGSALGGVKSVVTHQRLDFFLLAMDQLVNSAAKWNYMFGGQTPVPITIRLIVGRGWGQGPTHSQNLHSWFAHIPGLKVVMPTFPEDAQNLLIKSIFDPNPVIFIEHRWLHSLEGSVQTKKLKDIKEESKVIKKGKDITIVSMSYLTNETVKASKILSKHFNIETEIIDLRYIKPLDLKTIFKSVKKTNRLIVLDTAVKICSISSEICANVSAELFNHLKSPPISIAMPDIPEPTSYALTKDFHINYETVVKKVLEVLNRKDSARNILAKYKKKLHHDQPHKEFLGPF